jgi:DNA repair protein RadD
LRRGIDAGFAHSKNPESRKIINAYKQGHIQALVNIDMLTTGFNVPRTDLVAILRPSESPGLITQIIGRGSRLAEGKENCIVLDFGGNLARHGPIDTMEAKEPARRGTKEKEPLHVKICPECNGIMRLAAETCPQCGEVYPKRERETSHDGKADTQNVILSSQDKPRWVKISAWRIAKGQKSDGTPEYIRITYLYGVSGTVSQFMLFDHGGMNPARAARQWIELTGNPNQFTPKSTDEAFTRRAELRKPDRVQVARDGKYFKIMAVDHGRLHEAAA